MQTRFLFPLYFFLLAAASFLVAADPVTDADRDAISRTVPEIIPLLSEKPIPLLPPISDRLAWEMFAGYPGNAQILPDAEKFLNQPIPEAPEELYKEYYRTGNRENYQTVWYLWEKRLTTLALAELIENQGRFLPALEGTIRFICAYPSWKHPAHDYSAQVYDGKLQAPGLASGRMASHLALIRGSMKEKLSPEISDLVAENVRHRILEPIRTGIETGQIPLMWWIQTLNNWSPVCFCGILTSALSICESREERAWYLAAAKHFVTKNYFKSYGDDGYCTEGISYWNYGFGHFAMMAELIYRTTSGQISLFQIPKVKAVTEYGLKMEVAPGCYPAFADAPAVIKPFPYLIALMSLRLGLGLTDIENEGSPDKISSRFLAEIAVFVFPDPNLTSTTAPQTSSDSDTLNTPRSFFENAGVLICRGIKGDTGQISAFMKGGHNGEDHNHNDLGSFGVVRGRTQLILDPGKETYTSRTFSKKRYESELINSYGHSVPRIGEQLQPAGRNIRAAVTKTVFTDELDLFSLDLTAAYPDTGAEQVTRSFLFTHTDAGTPNSLTVTDRFRFSSDTEQPIEIPFVTFSNWEQLKSDTGTLFRIFPDSGEPGIVIRVTSESSGNPVSGTLTETTIGADDPSAPLKPRRITWSFSGSGEITVITEIKPE